MVSGPVGRQYSQITCIQYYIEYSEQEVTKGEKRREREDKKRSHEALNIIKSH